MHFISGNSDDDIGKFLKVWWEENTGHIISGPYSAIGILNSDNIKGVIVFMDHNGSNIEAHVCAFNCLTRTSLRYFFNYIFNELRCNILRIKVRVTNKKTLNIVNKLGFIYEYTLEQYFGPSKNEDAVMFKFKRKQASKWIKLVN